VDGTFRLWDAANGRELQKFAGLPGAVLSVACSPDKRLALAGDSDGRVTVWDLTSGRELQNYLAHHGNVRSVAFSPDGKFAWSGGDDGTVKLWEVVSGRKLHSLVSRRGGVLSVAFSAGAKTVVSGGVDGTVTLVNFSRAEAYQAYSARLPGAFDAIDKNPGDPGALAIVGDWYAFRGLWDWAIEYLEKARQGGAAVSSLTLADCYWELGRLDDAKREFHRGLEAGGATDEYLKLCFTAAATADEQNPKP